MKLLLIHGGLYEGMTAERFWARPGVTAGLEKAGLACVAPDRLVTPTSWKEEAAHVASSLDGPHAVVAGSNGCSVALRLALDYPGLVSHLVLCWPATNGDEAVDGTIRRSLSAKGVANAVIANMLAGGTIRGVSDAEIATVSVPVALIPSDPENPLHQRRTVDNLSAILRDCVVTEAYPEAPRPSSQRIATRSSGAWFACSGGRSKPRAARFR